NIRKARIEDYITTHSVRIDRTIEIDAMLGTLDLVAKSDWVTILPGVICAPDQDGKSLQIAPIDQPPLYLELVHIQTARRSLSPQAKAFLDTLRSEAETLVAT
ncbi:MAG: LysR substrate-binding domain-containing protein, partial [Pseudomonadota bacterium]